MLATDSEEFPIIQTKRLLLREIVEADAAAVLSFRGDAEVQYYNGGAESAEQVDALIAEMSEGFRDKTMIEWGVTLGPDSPVIGLFGYAHWSQTHRRAEIRYCLARDRWRRGIAFEALEAIVRFGFERMDLNRIHACPWVENTASVRLLEKLGFQKEGHLRDEFWRDGSFHDEAQYALLRRDHRG